MVVIDSMFVYYFVDPDLRVDIFFEKEEAAENGGIDFEIGDVDTSAQLYGSWINFHAKPVCSAFLLFF